MNTLEKICADKRIHVEERKAAVPFDTLKRECENLRLPSGFLTRLKSAKGPALIAEVKKASPSKGLIREDFDPVKIAQIYQKAGATCLSVLTDMPYFQGHDDYLRTIINAVDLPVLRKDFMLDPYQIYESRVLGADCVLLIMAALEDSQAQELYETALELHLDILVEVHNLEELERALRLDPMMIGVNNRNLKTLEVNIGTSLELLLNLPHATYTISESGIADHATMMRLHKAGYRGFLVGESLMRQDDIEKAVLDLLHG